MEIYGVPMPPRREVGDSAGGATHHEILKQRVRQRLDELHMTARGASLEAGLRPDAVRTIFSGKSKSPRAENLAALADVLQCDVAYLLGRQPTPFSTSQVERRSGGQLIGIVPLLLRGHLQLGFKKSEWSEEYPDAHLAPTDITSLPQYLPGYQAIEEIRDSSFDRMFPQGTLLHVLYKAHWEGASVKDGELVILERQRLPPGQDDVDPNEEPSELERSLRRVRQVTPEVVTLETFSTNPALQDSVMWEGPGMNLHGSLVRTNPSAREALSVEGFVLRAHFHVSGPGISGEPFRTWEAVEAFERAAGILPLEGDK